MVSTGMHYSWPTPSLPNLQRNDSYIKISSSVAWLMIGFSTSITALYVARVICGLAEGWICTIIPMYIGEIADPQLRGFLGSTITVTWLLGFLLINILGSYLSVPVTAFISCSVPIITMLSFSCMPESPYYLLMKMKYGTARKSLQIFRGGRDVEDELNRITSAIKIQTANRGKFSYLFTIRSNRKALYIAVILTGAQQLCGPSAITFYSQSIFSESGSSFSSETSTIVYFSIQLVVATVSSTIVDKAGRKPLLIISGIGSAIPLLVEGIYFYIKLDTDLNTEQFSLIPLLGLIAFIIFFSIGLNTIPFLVIGEIFPVNTKAFALFMADVMYNVIATLASKFFQVTNDYFGMYVPFFVFAILSLVGVLVIAIVVPETKGKTLEDIQNYLENKSDSGKGKNYNMTSFV